MSRCLSSSMTGSTDTGPLQPQEDPAPLPAQPSTFERPGSEDSSLARRGRRRHQPRRKMTSAPASGQTIQLTPLWEHVVRTRRFPSEVDTQATFVEISERLRDPEWEVRQHALRVLMDVLPTLNTDVVDKVMQPVVPELINNLGHPAPAVRKGALDTLRVYLVHSPSRDSMVKNILHDGLNRPDAHNPFQTNVTTGVILSAPLLLFPSSDSPAPTSQVLKDATVAFASRLVQVPHQEAVLKSLMKIRDAVGEEEFNGYLVDYDDNMKKNIELLSKIYNIRPGKRKQRRQHATDIMKADKERANLDKSHWDSDSDTSGIAEEEDETPNGAAPPGRVVLETEIKFNEETAITMTILEEKDDEDDSEEDGSGRKNVEGEAAAAAAAAAATAEDVSADPSSEDKRKTPRRVHFGGEIVKLRTPDSDETESLEIATPKTRIPLPVSPATKMPERVRRRPWSQPCSPHAEKRSSKRASRSASSSPKRETYTHNAQLSPKKSILARTNSSGPIIVVEPAIEETKNARSPVKERRNGESTVPEAEGLREIGETFIKDQVAPQVISSSPRQGERSRARIANDEAFRPAIAGDPSKASSAGERIEEAGDRANVVDLNEHDVVEASSKQEKDRAPTETSSPSQRSHKGNRENPQVGDGVFGLEERKAGSDFFDEVKSNVHDFAFGSPVHECDARFDRLVGGDFVDEQVAGLITEVHAALEGDGERKGRGQRDRKNLPETNGSVTCSSSEGEGKPQEPNWEELGLVGQEVLDDLHNKDDWRARVRALERVASALRTSSALIAIESRLGSLLHAVLGGERSCRVAAAGLAVAKVVVADVSEDALRRKLPQLAWGLARQGGPAAAQLARIAMLRLKPGLLLEQLLQPHCLCARNAKTRENALQLLIFSLVTFPSTEFKLETVANRVATMVADRRRRVRQAALDTLAVLAQIYDPEEVLAAGKRAGDGSPDAEAMLAAIRARLARKSLPLVSADGLVVYGLQISPTVQIATGPDVDWIVAGSGSVSPGTGRTRGQIIATSRSAQGRASRNVNNRESPWTERPNLVALGVGLQSKNEQPLAWQILRSQSNDDNDSEITGSNGRNANAGLPSNFALRFGDQLRSSSYASSSSSSHDPVGTDSKNPKEILDNNFEQKIARSRKDLNEIAKEKDAAVKGDSKIPVLLTRERHKVTTENREKNPANLEHVGPNSRRQAKDALDSNRNRINSRPENNVGSYASTYQRRKRLQREEASQFLNHTFDSHFGSYRSSSYARALGTTSREYNDAAESREAIFSDDNSHYYGRFVDNDTFTNKNESSDYGGGGGGGRQRSLPRNMQQQTLVETYSSIHERQEKLMDRNAYRPLRTAPSPLSRVPREFPNFDSQVADNEGNAMFRSREGRTKDAQQRTEADPTSSDLRENGRPFPENFADPHRRRLRSLSPSQLHRSRQFIRLTSGRYHTASMYDIDKATVNEEEYNARNKRHFSPETRSYNVQTSNKEESRYQEFLRSFSVSERIREPTRSASSSSSDASRSDRQDALAENRDARSLRDRANDSNNNNNDDDDGSRLSSPRSQYADPAFDIITQQATSRPIHDDVDSFFGGPLYTGNNSLVIDFFTYLESLLLRRKFDGSPSFDATFYFPTLNTTTATDDSSKVEGPIEGASALIGGDEASKEWSSEDETKPTGRLGAISRHSEHGESVAIEDENCNGSTTGSSSGFPEQLENRSPSARRIANERILPYDEPKVSKESLQATSAPRTASPNKSESLYQSPNHSTRHSSLASSPSKRISRCGSRNLPFEHQNGESRDSSEERLVASIVLDEDASIRSLDPGRPQIDGGMTDTPAIIIASRPHSHETIEYVENARNVENASVLNRNNTEESTEEESSVNDTLEDRQSKDSASETNTEPGILKIEPQSMDIIESRRKIASKVPVRDAGRYRALSMKKAAEKPSEKSKRMVQQCFAQLESKDWEVTTKGLKSLSQIAKQSPEYLDVLSVGTIARLLGRHVRNLRSQVARAACLAAGDVFSSQIRGIDQDLDEIAGPLLHRTADTNRFLRADCNAALDQMVQHLPPHKTIGVIVLRGASHQNAIVRATTARLLSDITDRIGPDHVMILPRDVKDKLLNSGARLLMDGNLDARNHSKRMFRRLTRCEGFRKALTDAVPETTLRHIDKTMKTL
ncbi:uncharacterized protein LOC105185536 isoform X1 [Harpegnathos saltator]|uniref:uncharacterized protein LOC105185536 isoform X1 n=2 Tax=Harpegnathos saltator TaxID=610380 RepID=UPI000DBEEC25|nr:uncharacterized protein LOC105185536 isoform X1 [Harpegnathos saltator]XP_025156271.1 uncharacterized protein LOC105185536 isoform X1 [Harpegnathos saltator]